jgi:hypothetical protein
LSLVAVAPACGDDDNGSSATTTAPSAASTTTAPGSSSTVAPTTAVPTTTALSRTELALVVWPFSESTTRYDDPTDAARGFATELVGFEDPVVGPFLQGDNRSGEVEIRANERGPVTTVFVRQFGPDDTWWVMGSATENIQIDDPQPQGAIDDPLQLSGRSRAFEAVVDVSVVADGRTAPIGTGFVMGGSGPDFGVFRGSIPFESPHGGWGSVILSTRSAENGQVWEASVVRVGFIGGD